MASTRPTYVRHIVLWLTVVAYMITYMDRVVIGSAAPEIRKEFNIDITTMGLIMGSFRLSYSIFQIPAAWLGDVYGPRKALAAIVTLWSFFTSATAMAWNVTSMMIVRFLFGMGEAGAFPIATRSLSRWMLRDERGYAQGVTHAGSRLGAAFTPPIVGWLIIAYGWRAPFFAFGVLGIVWAAVWFFYYRDSPREHKAVNEAELRLIEEDRAKAGVKTVSGKVPWKAILSSGNLWTLCAAYFCYAFCLAVYLDWFPSYLKEARHLDIKTMGFYASLPLFAGTLGDFFGGWISDRLVAANDSIETLRSGRRWVAIAGFLLAAAGIVPAAMTSNPELCIVLTCLAVFGLELTVGVSWAVPLDIGGDYAGSVSAVMNTCGNLGGTLSTTILGVIVTAYGWQTPFFIAASGCLIAAGLYLLIDPAQPIAKAPAQPVEAIE